MKGNADGRVAHKLLGQPTRSTAATTTTTCQSHDIAPGQSCARPTSCCASVSLPLEQSGDSQGYVKWSQDEESVNCRLLHVRHNVKCEMVEQLQIDRQAIDRLKQRRKGGLGNLSQHREANPNRATLTISSHSRGVAVPSNGLIF